MNALIINGHIRWPEVSEGKLNQRIFEETTHLFQSKGYDIVSTNVDSGYDIEEETLKWVNADYVLFHFPINWFGYPGKTKEYIDQVLMNGYGRIYAGDGRNNGGNYGTGGLLKAKGMIVNTWNAPKEVFDNPGQLLKGKSMEDFILPFTVNLAFLGIAAQPSFAFYDVFRSSEFIEDHFKSYAEHLLQYI
jgi:modulator of drug activity B